MIIDFYNKFVLFKSSLRGRLLIAASVVLLIFLTLAELVLIKAYEHSVKVSQYSKLESDLHDLLRIADPSNSTTITISGEETDRRLMQPDSGLFAEVTNSNANTIWVSPSSVGLKIPFHKQYTPSEQKMYEIIDSEGEPLFAISMGIQWIDKDGDERNYTFSVAERKTVYLKQVTAYKRVLWLWLLAIVFILLLLQWAIVNWGIKPIKFIAKQAKDIRYGERNELDENTVTELSYLIKNLNDLLKHERKRQIRYRNALADLAHSLKTPLSVLQSTIHSLNKKDVNFKIIEDQIKRIDQITSYQLQRAATSGRSVFVKPIPIAPIINKIIFALKKVYSEKKIKYKQNILGKAVFFGEEGDCYELLGNLLDNAFKYCAKHVQIIAKLANQDGQIGLLIELINDGESINEKQKELIMQRGVRADTKHEGQGIGLSVVSDIITAYEGRINITDNNLSGTIITVFIPK